MRRSTRFFLVFSLSPLVVASCRDDQKIGRDPSASAVGGGAGISGAPGGSLPQGGRGAQAGEASRAGQGGGGGAQAGASGAGDGGSSAVPGGFAGASLAQEDCPTDLPGAKLIRIKRPDGRAACIDQREATQGEYHAFIAKVGEDGFRALGFCAPESMYYGQPEPTGGGDDHGVYGTCKYDVYHPETTPDAPMGCIDRCQAAAYCAWAGKELCGGFDDEKTLSEEEVVDPSKSIWANACTNGGTTTVSHESKDPASCGTERKLNEAQKEPVGSYPECHGQGAYAEILNLSGGVAEWVNAQRLAPSADQLATWLRMGPLWGAGEAYGAACGSVPRGTDTWSSGFRCCKRLPK